MTHLLIWNHSLYDLRSTEVFIRDLKVAGQKSWYFLLSNSSIEFLRNICISLRRYWRFTEHVGFFSSDWPPHGRLWTTVYGTASPTQCKSLHLMFRPGSHLRLCNKVASLSSAEQQWSLIPQSSDLTKCLAATANRSY